MNEAAATSERQVRDEFLALTSDLRRQLGELSSGADGILSVGERLARSVEEHGLQAAVRHTGVVRRMVALGAAAGSGATEDGESFRSAVRLAIGILEQVLEGCLDGTSKERLEALYADLVGALPSPWGDYATLDEAAFEARLQESRLRADSSPQRPDPAERESSADTDPATDAAGEVFRAFVTEADEGLQRCEEYVVRLEQDPEDDEILAALFGELHTLKGAAAAAGVSDAAAQLHEGETLLAAVREGREAPEAEDLADRLFCLIDSVRSLVEEKCAEVEAAARRQVDTRRSELQGAPVDLLVSGRQALDRGIKELSAAGSGGQVDEQMQSFLRALDEQTRQFSEIAEHLRTQMNTLRLVPLDRIFRRLLRPARDAAQQQGKLIEVKVTGGSEQVDREIAERLTGVLLHLVRNAVSHGIERPEVREEAGKDPSGRIGISARKDQDQIVIAVEDDGKGLDVDAIRRRGEQLGFLKAGASVSREELVRTVFRPGFSTSSEVTDLSGRGVGLDAVARDVKAFKGRIAVDTRPGRGCRFRVLLPAAAAPPHPAGTRSGDR